MSKIIGSRIAALMLAIPAITLSGCQSSGRVSPEMLTGDQRVTDNRAEVSAWDSFQAEEYGIEGVYPQD
ncbi:MAG: hypothetical protein V3W34_12410 [Phycisphaerae bacterium]